MSRFELRRRHFLTGALAVSATGCAGTSAERRFADVDMLVNQAVAEHKTPGAVVVISHHGSVVYQKVFGNRSLVPVVEPMTYATRFDMASLTKPTMTACAAMQFWEAGAFKLDDKVGAYFPNFAVNGKQDITIRHLMTHYSGLPPDVDLSTPWVGKDHAVQLAMNATPISGIGEKFIYSDINFIMIGLLIEKLSGTTLDRYVTEHVITPLGMTQSGYRPADISNVAPTQFDEHGVMMRGVVHDPTTRRMGNVAGHAGLFSDAADMSHYARALLDRRAGRPSIFPLKTETVMLMSTPQQPAGKTELRGLGWDIDTHYSSLRGERFPKGSFGHTGFTGTSLWMDPSSDTYVIILTNRVHPDGTGNVVKLRHDVANAAAIALGV